MGKAGVTAGRNPPMRNTQAPSRAFFIARNRTRRSRRWESAKDGTKDMEKPVEESTRREMSGAEMVVHRR